MSHHEAPLRAVLEALDEQTEFHGRSARIAYTALRAAGVEAVTAGWHVASVMLPEMERLHADISLMIEHADGGTRWHRQHQAQEHARRLRVIVNLRNLTVALAPAEAA